ncbi:MAG: hypothetical protein HKN26_13995 [Acidimicrobiales bacterium]|nr:hypothetical protein [Acidimicrobiales bacterium]
MPEQPADAEFSDRFDEALREIEERKSQEQLRSGLWLSHHHSDQLDRCAVIGGRHVCRRCLWFYPIAITVAVIGLAGGLLWPDRLDWWVIMGLSSIATAEFVAEQLGLVEYSPRRQIVATAAAALAFGRALGLEIADRWQPKFWLPIAVFGAIWLAAALINSRRRPI